MDERIPGTMLAILLAVWIIATAYFFSLTGIRVAQFLTINFLPLSSALASVNFILFIICFSVCIALILTIGRKYLFKFALLFIIPSCIIGILISILLFPTTIDFLVPLAGLFIGIPLGISYLAQKEQELHYLVGIRSGASAAGRILLPAAIAFFLYLLLIGMSEKQQLEDNFLGEFLAITIDNNISLGDKFQAQFANAIATQQLDTIDKISKLQEVKNLEAKNDEDALLLVTRLGAMKTLLSSEEFKQDIITQMKNTKVDFGAEIMKQLPMIQKIAQIAWAFYAIMALVMVLFISNIFIKNISALVYGVLLMLYPKNLTAEKAKQKAEPNNNG